ncbi:hypothetical protein [Nocardioides sp. MH1]|uniref:hypothetical protein n=1 Tax=Nocardioides sp. MH1 TaxID=3242490 RepID=UPI00351FABD3
MEKFLTLMLALQTRVAERDEKGQGTLEYVGMIVVAALLAAAVIAAARGVDLGSVFTDAVNSVIGG